jgi:chaperonin GroES
MNLQPLGDRLIVEVLDEEETTVGGLVLPDTAKEKPQRGRVLAVGPGSRDDNGKFVPMDLAEGDEIVFSKYGGTEIKLGTGEVLILRETDVLAKVVNTGGKRKRKFLMTGPDLLDDDDRSGWPLRRDPLPLESNQPGVFVAGDVRHGSIKRVANAVGEGSMAIKLINQHRRLSDDEKRSADALPTRVFLSAEEQAEDQ